MKRNRSIWRDGINPDGVEIRIAWDEMRVTSSVFIPCVNTEEARAQAARHMLARGWKFHAQPLVENNKWGLRIWRTA